MVPQHHVIGQQLATLHTLPRAYRLIRVHILARVSRLAQGSRLVWELRSARVSGLDFLSTFPRALHYTKQDQMSTSDVQGPVSGLWLDRSKVSGKLSHVNIAEVGEKTKVCLVSEVVNEVGPKYRQRHSNRTTNSSPYTSHSLYMYA
jgi:hypothetical protein